MCDTVVATGAVTRDGVTLFGKNSDREPNEAHHLLLVPAQDHPAGAKLRLTYIEIPQVAHTCAVLLAKPFWMWGAEMGTNEYGLTIGNEAVFTRLPYQKEAGMPGMDLLRLGLERAPTARQALDVMTTLLAEYRQGGNGGFQHPFYYHNSYILADPHDAWVLETAGPHWAARQVQGVYTISNGITITTEWDLASPDLVNYAVERGWCRGRDDFDFASCYSNPLYTYLSDCRRRCQRTRRRLEAQAGRIDPAVLMSALRDHGPDARPDWQPGPGLLGKLRGNDVCMHAGFGPVRGIQTTGSQVSHLHPTHPTHFFTATAAPCTSLFKPVWLDAGLPDAGPLPQGDYDPHSLFWRHERLHRATLEDYPTRHALYAAERDALEQGWVNQALAAAQALPDERLAFSQGCFDQAVQAEAAWLERLLQAPARPGGGLLYRAAWREFNRQARWPEAK